MATEIKIGQWVMHHGCGLWAEVLEIVSRGEGRGSEHRVRIHDLAGPYDANRETWWATYHLSDVRDEKPPRPFRYSGNY